MNHAILRSEEAIIRFIKFLNQFSVIFYFDASLAAEAIWAFEFLRRKFRFSDQFRPMKQLKRLISIDDGMIRAIVLVFVHDLLSPHPHSSSLVSTVWEGNLVMFLPSFRSLVWIGLSYILRNESLEGKAFVLGADFVLLEFFKGCFVRLWLWMKYF